MQIIHAHKSDLKQVHGYTVISSSTLADCNMRFGTFHCSGGHKDLLILAQNASW